MKRPWQGQVEPVNEAGPPEFDAKNPLCPGVVRSNGEVKSRLQNNFVFNNDFPALLPDVPNPPTSTDPLFQMGPAQGVCKVMCFHPKSNISIPDMTIDEITNIINSWIELYEDLAKKYEWVQIFENKGFAMGCSNPHPHCQIWATSFIPHEPATKDSFQQKYYEKYGRPLLMDYVQREIEKEIRIVTENDDWLIVVPYWAVWPFETLLLPKTHVKRISELRINQKESLADIIRILVTKYDNLFQCSFPYSMGWHGAPTGSELEKSNDHWTLHALYYPPLLRSASVKKFMVGFELLAQSQRDLTPEQAAKMLRDVSSIRLKK
ncbi:probable galactose-1-phosphate uridylyltransferase [Ctenocephalides felis]|uniref:probable galactose-1-phosphate uridylyltransferase n=1 Tax=Ctenocephalides felis TaxID=7515 RepID=UPI000E6E339F|nr:probable galactose-1-phosphate uridylyltransferase [Ctenocephalides felis]